MVCVYCSNETQVINSRHQKKTNQVWRRRKCTSCHAIYTTIEATDASQALRLRRKTNYETGSSKTKSTKILSRTSRRSSAAKTSAATSTNTSSSKTSPTKLEPFSRDILLLSIYDSLRHRKTAVSDASALTATIMSQVYRLSTEATIDREALIELTTTILKRFDKVAAIHYSAFHPIDR